MQKFKKAVLFILGLYIIPVLLGHISASIFGSYYFKIFSGYFVLVYLLIYFLFPHFYKTNSNKKYFYRYMPYALLYLVFWILGAIIFVGFEL